tara:strand:+ start:1106 stop:1945 length:840 start_codon:yes stop_codon:yes gene_type:complete
MKNRFKELDTLRTQLSDNLFYNVISSEKSFRARKDIAQMLDRLSLESEEDLTSILQARSEKLEKPLSSEQSWKVSEKWVKSFDATNKTVVFLDNEKREILALAIFMINDPETKQNLGIKEENFLIFIKALTQREQRNTGLLTKLAFKTLEIVNKQNEGVVVIGCVALKNTVLENGEQRNYAMNLPRYASMFEKSLIDTKLQVRYADKDQNQFGKDRFDLKEFLSKQDGSVNESTIKKIITQYKPKAREENKELIGFYVEGKTSFVDKLKDSKLQITSRL